MTEVVLYHHVQGLTPGVRSFADDLRQAGHTVHTPDLFDGKTFASIPEGMAHVHELGFETVIERGARAAESLPNEIAYVGFSLGVLPAQYLTQTRARAKGAVLCHACVPPSEFGTPWPDGVPVQIHLMEEDEETSEDLGFARELVATVPTAELFLYPGDKHLFADPSLPDYDAPSAKLLTDRLLAFLDGVRPSS
jgi:dienelactone hydrolase